MFFVLKAVSILRFHDTSLVCGSLLETDVCEGALAERRRAWFLSDMLAALLAAETGLIVALQMILNCVQ